MPMRYEFVKHQLSVVSAPPDAGALIAVNAMPDEGMISWWDPLHQRMFALKQIERDVPDRLEFIDKKDRRFTLTPMTLAAYYKQVLPHMPAGRRFTSHNEMLTFFTRTVWGLK